jgi:sterol desaturase/sphingolipid hydroxylase (fatty acid hydroxylase superfamily)
MFFALLDLDRWMLRHGENAQFALFFALLAIFTLTELLAPKRPAIRGARWRANYGLTAINVVAISLLPTSFFGGALWAERNNWGLLNLVEGAWWWLLPANLLARGFISFFTHWLNHRVPWLWRIHRVHHLDHELDVSTTVRFHPLEFATGLALGLPVVLLFGLSPWMLVLYELLDVAVNLFSHANLRLPDRLERVLRPIIVTPGLHRVHHSSWQPETDSNFSAVFPVWDILFGTYRTETREPASGMQLGLEEVRDARTTRVGWLLTSPLRANLSAGGETPALLALKPPRLALLFLALALLAHFTLPALGRGFWHCVACGVAPAAAGFGLMIWAWAEFRRRANPICPTQHAVTLITAGPFRFTRNPMYLGIGLMLAAPFLAYGSVALALAPLSFFIMMAFVFVPFEEDRLRQAFGVDFENYRRAVRRWI